MRSRITASLRATAIRAFFIPERLQRRMPQALSEHHFWTRVSSTPAASNKYVRNMVSPHLDIRPVPTAISVRLPAYGLCTASCERSEPPREKCDGLSPNIWRKAFPRRRLGRWAEQWQLACSR